ncbi:MAG TPA: methyltransferase domain-containing protein [Rudaea sp.]|nr:methyltransferase domain-containing protein [Rudaea sp.]
MATAAEHYENHLAPLYPWMAGGSEAALQAGDAEIAALDLLITPGSVALDLGAGFGMHAIPLARRGVRVVAIDSSVELLRTLTGLRGDLPIEAVRADLLDFQRFMTRAPCAILCMGDTITHLPGLREVDDLLDRAAAALARGGSFVVSFRDYSVPLVDERRFIAVRNDATRILTCFLEYEEEVVRVHDILHELGTDGWQTRVSHYPKLRLPPRYLVARLESHGLNVRREAGIHGMLRIVARKT